MHPASFGFLLSKQLVSFHLSLNQNKEKTITAQLHFPGAKSVVMLSNMSGPEPAVFIY